MGAISDFGHYESEDLDVIVHVKGIDERKDIVGAGMRLFDMFDARRRRARRGLLLMMAARTTRRYRRRWM